MSLHRERRCELLPAQRDGGEKSVVRFPWLTSIFREERYSKLACSDDLTALLICTVRLVLHYCCWTWKEEVKLMAGHAAPRCGPTSPLDSAASSLSGCRPGLILPPSPPLVLAPLMFLCLACS